MNTPADTGFSEALAETRGNVGSGFVFSYYKKTYRVHLSIQITFRLQCVNARDVAPHKLHAVKENNTHNSFPIDTMQGKWGICSLYVSKTSCPLSVQRVTGRADQAVVGADEAAVNLLETFAAVLQSLDDIVGERQRSVFLQQDIVFDPDGVAGVVGSDTLEASTTGEKR